MFIAQIISAISFGIFIMAASTLKDKDTKWAIVLAVAIWLMGYFSK